MAERTPEEVMSGLLPVKVGGTTKAVPTLKVAQIAEWALLLDTLTDGTPARSADWAEKGVSAVASITNGAYLDLITAYDRTSALGGREWLAEHADPKELSVALEQMADNAFPLGGGGPGQVAMSMSAMVLRTLAALAPPSITSGSSASGTSRPNRSARRSTRSK